jgi:hypothetical protein
MRDQSQERQMCAIDGADGSYAVYNRRIVKARKAHKCDECHRDILPGQFYEKVSGLNSEDGGHWDVWHTCDHCRVACDWLTENCGGFLHAAVLEDIEEHVDEYHEHSRMARGLQRLVVGMKRGWSVKHGPAKGKVMALPRLPMSIKTAMERAA